MTLPAKTTPNPTALYEIASIQAGLFTTVQAGTAGYSDQLIAHHVKGGRFERVRRGIYRLVRFPLDEQEELVELWLWANQQGVFSHETALGLYSLSDVLPSRAEMTVPLEWKKRRLTVPEGLALRYRNLTSEDLAWVGLVPVTSVERTIRDCFQAHSAPRFLAQAIEQAESRGLIARAALDDIRSKLPSLDAESA